MPRFTDKDGDEYIVELQGDTIIIEQHSPSDQDRPEQYIAFYPTDGGKLLDAIKTVMLEAALGGNYSAGEPLADSGDDA